jgi:hypothetical protein
MPSDVTSVKIKFSIAVLPVSRRVKDDEALRLAYPTPSRAIYNSYNLRRLA